MTERQQERTAEGGVPTRIGQAVILHRAGDREEARNRLAALWQEIGPAADPLHRCTLAHYLAATQDTPQARLAWDLTALEAAEGFVTTRGAGAPGADVAESAGLPGPGADGAFVAGAGSVLARDVTEAPGAAAGPAVPDERPGGSDGPRTRGGTSGDPAEAGERRTDDGRARGDGLGGDGERRGPGRPLAGLRALFPVLHLSLVADYAALGRPADARTHLLRARTWTAALPDGAHRQTLYADIDRLGTRLDGGPGRR
ncbi:hypothetical protein [Streptomyces sp. NPDC002067]